MRVFIPTLGSRGDFEQFLLLGRQLRSRGHEVLIGTSGFLEARTREAGLEWERLGDSTQEELVAALRSLSSIGNRTERTRRFFRSWLGPQLKQSWKRILSLGGAADYFISSFKLVLKSGDTVIPGASVTYDPPHRLEDLARYGTQDQGDRILDLVALNKRLVDPQDRWGERFRFTGFWVEERTAAWEAPADLMRNLDAGPPPVVIAMGSSGSAMFDLGDLLQAVQEALRRSGQRGIVVGGWSAASAVAPGSEWLHCVDEAPYEWLFPRVSCVIHHGGVGTLATALRAGKPSIVLPQLGCQEQFGEILVREGLATGVFDTLALDPGDLANAIRAAVDDDAVRSSAKTWQGLVAADPGVAEAADLIDAHWRSLQA